MAKSIIQQKGSLYADFRSGSILDFIGSNDGSFVSTPVFNREGLRLDGADDAINFGATGLTVKTVAILLNPNTTSEDIADLDGGTHTIEVGAGTITATGFAAPTIYVNGVASSTLAASTQQLITITTATGISASAFKAGQETTFFDGIISVVFTSADELTASEAAELHSELSNIKYPTKTISRKKDNKPNELTDGDMEASGVSDWTAGGSATLTKETANPKEGQQVLRIIYNGANNPEALQSILTIGKMYRVKGWARSSGVQGPIIRLGAVVGWSGTTSTDWQWFDFTNTADAATFRLYNNLISAGYVEFDDVQVIDLGKSYSPTVFHTDYGAYESVANETAGNLSNTPFQISTGTWKISTDTINGQTVKVIENVVAGVLSIPTDYFQSTPAEAAYGTWEWYQNKTDAGTINIGFGSNKNPLVTGNYRVTSSASEVLTLAESGVSTMLTAGTAVQVNAWDKIKLTRTGANEFELFLNNVSQGTASDATITGAEYLGIDCDAGDRIAYSNIRGGHSIVKKLEV